MAAASHERAYGVHFAIPSTTAMRPCAELAFVPVSMFTVRSRARSTPPAPCWLSIGVAVARRNNFAGGMTLLAWGGLAPLVWSLLRWRRMPGYARGSMIRRTGRPLAPSMPGASSTFAARPSRSVNLAARTTPPLQRRHTVGRVAAAIRPPVSDALALLALPTWVLWPTTCTRWRGLHIKQNGDMAPPPRFSPLAQPGCSAS